MTLFAGAVDGKYIGARFRGAPCEGEISSLFWVIDDAHDTPHSGDDIAAPSGTPVRAPADGWAWHVGVGDPTFGNWLILEHESGEERYHSLYAHLLYRPSVGYGQLVNRGQVIGFVGSTGESTGPHLHWGLSDADVNPWLNKALPLLDPLDYLIGDEDMSDLKARIAALEQWREELTPKIDEDWAWRAEHEQEHATAVAPPPEPAPAPPDAPLAYARAVAVNTDVFAVDRSLFAVQEWLKEKHGCTFTMLPPLRVDCQPNYEAIKAELHAQGVALSVPTYGYAPAYDDPSTHAPWDYGPGSFGDAEQLAVKEVADAGCIAHELAHLWTQTGNESHDDVAVDDDGNPWNDLPSVLSGAWVQFPQCRLLPQHLEAALASGFIRRL